MRLREISVFSLRPRLPGETKTPKFRLKLLTKATFYDFVSLQVYPGYLELSLVFYFFSAIIKE